MKINLYKALPILLISADLLIYVIDSEIQVARFLTVIALIILLTMILKIKNREIINFTINKNPFFKYIFLTIIILLIDITVNR
jgi:hypothetical protein